MRYFVIDGRDLPLVFCASTLLPASNSPRLMPSATIAFTDVLVMLNTP